MSVISRRMNRGAASLLSTLALVTAGATVAVAVGDQCYQNNGMMTCFPTVQIDCGDGWTCESSAEGGAIQVSKVKKSPADANGTKELYTSTYTRIWAERECGPQPNSCSVIAYFTKTCKSESTGGIGCVGAAQ